MRGGNFGAWRFERVVAHRFAGGDPAKPNFALDKFRKGQLTK
jgi:hypothetical protein